MYEYVFFVVFFSSYYQIVILLIAKGYSLLYVEINLCTNTLISSFLSSYYQIVTAPNITHCQGYCFVYVEINPPTL